MADKEANPDGESKKSPPPPPPPPPPEFPPLRTIIRGVVPPPHIPVPFGDERKKKK